MIFEEITKKPISFYKKDIQTFFQQSGGRYAYRGVSKKFDDYFIKTHTLRQPVGLVENFLLADFFLQRKNFISRKDCIFVTGDQFQAERWGHVVITIPIGNFEFVWNKNIQDLNSVIDSDWFSYDSESYNYYAIRFAKNIESKQPTQKQLLQDLTKKSVRKFLEYTNLNLPKALSSHVEISLKASQYLMVPIEMIYMVDSLI